MTRQETERYFATIDHPMKGALSELCEVVRGIDPRIQESIKWNAPSFYISEHFATTGLSPGATLRLVLHTGAKKRKNANHIEIEDREGILTWKDSDRAIITFTSLDDVRQRAESIRLIVRQWIAATQ